MGLYSIMLFLHVSSAICLFIGMGIWLFGITAIARATRVEQVRTIADLMLMARLVVPVSAFLVIVAGLTMARIAWGLQTGWIAVALGSLVIIEPNRNMGDRSKGARDRHTRTALARWFAASSAGRAYA